MLCKQLAHFLPENMKEQGHNFNLSIHRFLWVQSHLGLHSKFQAPHGYTVIPHLKKNNKRKGGGLGSLSRNIAPEEEKSRKLRKISEDGVSAPVASCLWADPVRNRVSMTQKTTELPSWAPTGVLVEEIGSHCSVLSLAVLRQGIPA